MQFSIPVFLRLCSRSVLLTGAIALTLISLLTHTPAQAQNAPGARQRGGATYIKFEPPALGNAPGGRARGGASRGECPTVTQPLTALVPTINGSVGGLTGTDHPTFWFYVPYALTADHPAEFVLLDQHNKYVYQTTLIGGQNPDTGILGVTLPDTLTLTAGQSYQWVFMVNCEIDNPIFTRGSIQKITLNAPLAQQIAQAAPLEKARLYAEHGIWFDALTTLAGLKTDQPTDPAIAAAWKSLLESVDLADVADKPFVRQ
ncbi:MAG TPA: DUF928 domain-containing protein [Coleofasciculaceae cyanobacterium]